MHVMNQGAIGYMQKCRLNILQITPWQIMYIDFCIKSCINII